MKSFQHLTKRGRALRLRRLAWNALKQYDLDVVQMRLVTNDMNGIFQVETRSGEKWILRVTLPECGHNHDHVAAEMDWLAALAHDTVLSVPRPLPARSGASLVEASDPGVPEPRLCEIFSWVPGTDLANHINPANMLLLGVLSANLHEHARTYHSPAGLKLLAFNRVFPFPEPVILFEARYESLFTFTQRGLYRQGVDWAQTAIDRLTASGEPMRIIHADLHPWNVRFFRGVLSPIDFEDLMLGWPVQDIATTLYYIQDEPNYPEMHAAFEQGYQSVIPWPEHYAGEIDAFIAARGIGLLNFVLQNNELLGVDLQDFAGRIQKRLCSLMTRGGPG
jgi:Ser/Thr protein kinase RdoA (MazF antagonist)